MRKSVAIIGGGILGLTIAYKLAEKDYDITLYEASESIGRGASGHTAGVIHVVQPPPWKWKSKLTRKAYLYYDKLAEELGFDILRTKTHLVYRRGEGLLAKIVGYLLKLLGYKVSFSNRKDILVDCPSLNDDIMGAISIYNYRTVDPLEVLKALYHGLEDKGVELKFGTEIVKVTESKGNVSLVTSEDAIETYDYLVVAAGPGSGIFAEQLGLRKVRIGYFKGTMVFVDLDCSAILSGLRQPSRTEKTKGGAIIPWPDGKVIMGPSFIETNDPYDSSYTEKDLVDTSRNYVWMLKEEPKILGGFAGTRAKNLEKDDFNMQITRRSIVFQGIDSPGFSSAPILAELTCKWLGSRNE